MTNDTHERYGSISRLLHWGMAALILWQLLKLGDRMNDGEHWVGQTLVPWHLSVGALLLVLVALRLYWALKQRPHRPQHIGSRALLIRGGHILLYVVMVLLPVTGMLYVVGSGYALEVFGVRLVAESGIETDWMISVGSLHSPLALLFIALVIGHVAAALYHHFIERDDTLGRMVGTVEG